MNLKGRLRSLERAMAVGQACPVCRYGEGMPPKMNVTFDDVKGSATCAGCGRPLVLKVQMWPDGTGEGESAR